MVAVAIQATAPDAWLIACGAVYWLLLRPRLFGEREERKRLAEREAAEFQRYEDDWARLVSRYTSPGDSDREGAQSAAPSRRADASGGSDGAPAGRLPNGPTGHGHHSRR
ncbi:hypothetical protein PLESTM_000250900 [Pleodorina starrii]|nr:hypothetical protein PLESTM_000250900 [Pleodorina starrii]